MRSVAWISFVVALCGAAGCQLYNAPNAEEDPKVLDGSTDEDTNARDTTPRDTREPNPDTPAVDTRRDDAEPPDAVDTRTRRDTLDAALDTADTADGAEAGYPCSVEKPRTISGTLQIHPVTAAVDSRATLHGSQLGLYNALSLLAEGTNAEVLPRTSGAEWCVRAVSEFRQMQKSSDFTLASVDVDSVSTALFSLVKDAPGPDAEFVATGTPLASPDELSSDVDNATAYAVSIATVDKIASISAQSQGDLLGAGFVLGRVVDGQRNPVRGYRVGEVQQNNVEPFENAIYPNSDYTNASTGANGGSTSSAGVFVVPDQHLASFGATAGQGSVDTTVRQVATIPNVATTLRLSTSAP